LSDIFQVTDSMVWVVVINYLHHRACCLIFQSKFAIAIILSNSMSFGRPYIMKAEWYIHDGWLLLSEIEPLNKDFIYYLLSSDFVYEQFKRSTIWWVVQNLNIDIVKNTKIPLPPLDIQQQIVDLMDDALASKQSKEAEAQALLDSVDSYVMQELGIKYEEVEEKQCFVLKVNELSESKRLDLRSYSQKQKAIINWIQKSSFSLTTIDILKIDLIGWDWWDDSKNIWDDSLVIKVLRNTNFDNIYNLDLSDIAERSIKISKINQKKIQYWDILIEKSWWSEIQPVWRVAFCDMKDWDYLYSNFLSCLKIDQTLISSIYLTTYLKTLYRLWYMEYIQNQTTGIRNLIMEEFLQIPVLLPNSNTQNKIADEVQSRISRAQQLQSEASQIYSDAKKQVEGMILWN